MDDLTRLPKSDPTEIFRYRDGLYAPELLAAALVGLDFFSWLAGSPATAEKICAELGLAERPVDVMLALFSATGFIERRHETFHLTEVAREFLVRDSPWFVGPYYVHFADRPIYRALLETLRTDKPGGWAGVQQQKPWAQAMESKEFAERFTGTMDSRGMYSGPMLARNLDLRQPPPPAGYRGRVGNLRLLHRSGTSAHRSYCLRKAAVDRVARDCIAKRGFSERVNVTAGDMFQDSLPAGYDVHLWSNALHDWSAATVKELVQNSFAALPPGGLIAIHDRLFS